MFQRWLILWSIVLALSGCTKVPLQDAGTSFAIADAAWFEAEQTMFLFYNVSANQGLSKESRVEVSYETDDGTVSWTDISTFTNVHLHESVKCGDERLCGSASPKVVKEPRNIRFRLRYHFESDAAYTVLPRVSVKYAGPAHTNRSLIAYGVLNSANNLVQWRYRHDFPTLRNLEVEKLGLRRTFKVENETYGTLAAATDIQNPYLYGHTPTCPNDFYPLNAASVSGDGRSRAVFSSSFLPLDAADQNVVCAQVTVTDATGTFQTTAFARKNPDTRVAFDTLRSPIVENATIPFVIAPCNRVISKSHFDMQTQRLLLSPLVDVCIDQNLSEPLSTRIQNVLGALINTQRANNKDMVVTIALHHDDASGITQHQVQSALEALLPQEQAKSSPRVTGAFVFDSYASTLVRDSLRRLVLWCPAPAIDPNQKTLPDSSQTSCPVMPERPDLRLGPFRFGFVPILPTRGEYSSFVKTYGEDQAGETKSVTFRAPTQTPLTQIVPIGTFAQATFFNNEIITTNPGDAFSFCPSNADWEIVFRSEKVTTPSPVSSLPQSHLVLEEVKYELGVLWDFPFLMSMDYETQFTGQASVIGVNVPFSVKNEGANNYGSQQWRTADFKLGTSLLHCTRFCNHPSFDSAGVYNVRVAWKDFYASTCYTPIFSDGQPGEGSNPNDP